MRKKQTVTVIEPAPPTPQPIAPASTPYWRSVMTDHNGDFDLGALLVAVVICFMCLAEGYDVWRGKAFNGKDFGFGVGLVLGGFAAYKWGDARRPPPTTMTATAQQVS